MFSYLIKRFKKINSKLVIIATISLFIISSIIYSLNLNQNKLFTNFLNSDLRVEQVKIKHTSDQSNLNVGKYPLGLEFGHTGRIWLNENDENESTQSTVYTGEGDIVKTKDKDNIENPLSVKVANLTALVFSPGHTFQKDSWIFTTSDGKVYSWRKGDGGIEPLSAQSKVNNSSKASIYTGITTLRSDTGWRLYVADNRLNKIDIFDINYNKVNLKNAFIDETIPVDYKIFNIKEIDSKLYVVYAKENTVGGYVNMFDSEGKFIKRVISGSNPTDNLNMPWGIAKTPSNFGALSNKLLIANFGSNDINVYDLQTGNFIDKVKNKNGEILKINKISSLTFGTDNGAGKSNELFYSTSEGEFGKLNISNNRKINLNKINIENTDLNTKSDELEISQSFLQEKTYMLPVDTFQINLNKICPKTLTVKAYETCLKEKLDKNIQKINLEYKTLMENVDIMIAEYKAQNNLESKINLISDFKQNSQNNIKSELETIDSRCEISVNFYYADQSKESMKTLCKIYKTESLLLQLNYQHIFYIVGEFRKLTDIKTKDLKDLMLKDEENLSKLYEESY